jgi:short-subunit dehydrogenase
MKQNGGGSIVNIGSMWAKQAVNNLLQLILCKNRLYSFTQHLAMELADYNIRVNAKYYIVSRRFLAEKKQPKRHLKVLMASSNR